MTRETLAKKLVGFIADYDWYDFTDCYTSIDEAISETAGTLCNAEQTNGIVSELRSIAEDAETDEEREIVNNLLQDVIDYGTEMGFW